MSDAPQEESVIVVMKPKSNRRTYDLLRYLFDNVARSKFEYWVDADRIDGLLIEYVCVQFYHRNDAIIFRLSCPYAIRD